MLPPPLLDPIAVERLNALSITARRIVEGTVAGRHRVPVRGASVEFRQHRFYTPGDDPRRIDWRVLARNDRLHVREYDEETNLRAAIVLDTSGSMRYGDGSSNKSDFAKRLAASIAYLMLAQSESVGLLTGGEKATAWVAPRSGGGQLARILETLRRSDPAGLGNSSELSGRLAERFGRRGLVIWISDCLSPAAGLRSAFGRLIHARHEMLILRVLHKDEINFPFSRWARFTGLESEPPMLCETALAADAYRKRFADHQAALRADCRRLNIELATLTTDRPAVDALIDVLRRREKT